MNDEFKIKAVIEGEVDEKQLQDTGKKAGEIVGKSIPEQVIKLKAEKKELEQDLKQVKKTIDSLIKTGDYKLVYKAQLEKDLFEKELGDINKEIEDLTNKVQKGFDINAMGHLLNSGFFQKIGDGVVSLGKKVLDLGNQAQQAQVSFSTMLGDSEKARDMIKDLSEFAAKTPFELSGIRDSAKQLLAMGVQAEDMIPTLKSLGDVSAGLNVPLERLALNYGQVLTQGKLTGRELRDFSIAGVPLLDELAKNLNKSKTEIQDLVSKGEIGANDVVQAFRTMTSEGGKFANLMEEQSKTLGGLLSNLNDEINLTGEAIGEQLVPSASKLVGMLQGIMGGIREWVQENPNLTQGLVALAGTLGGLVAVGGTILALLPLLTAAFSGVGLVVTGVAVGISALVGAIVYLNGVIEDTQIKTEFMGETYESLTEKIKENEEALADLKKQLDDGVISIEEYEAKKEELEEREGKLKKALDNTYMSLNDVNTELENLSNQQISNTEKLKRLQEIKDKAFSTMKTVEQLKLSLASLDGKLATLVDAGKNGVNFNPFTKSGREQLKLGTTLLGKKVGSWFGLSESPEDYLKGIYTEKEALEERLTNYDEYKNKEAEIDKQIADLEVEIEKEKLKELNNLGGGGSGGSGSSSKNEINDKKKELKEKRDLMIKDVENSVSSEEEKYQKILEISDWYKNELAELEGKTTDNVIKNAEKQLKAIEEKNKKELSYYEDLEKVQDKIDDSVEKYKDNVKKVGDEWEKVKEKAQDSIREVNNAIEQLDKDYAKDTAERLNKVQEGIKEFERKNGSSEWLKGYSIDMLENRDSDEISGIKVKDAIEYLRLLEEQKWLNENISDDIKAQAESIKEISESQQKAIEYEEKRNALIEKRKMLEAVSNSTLENPGLRYKDGEEDIVQYFDTEEQEWKDITDFKNNEQAIDILNNKTTLDQKLLDLQTAHQNELKEYGNQVIEIKKKYENDTKNYKDELDKKKKAFAQYVSDMNALASQLSSRVSSNAYGGSLLSGNASRVGENGPEQIIARQSSYVQPRNAVNNNSTVYNNQSSYSINGMNIEVNNVDEFLNELKNRLTYRN